MLRPATDGQIPLDEFIDDHSTLVTMPPGLGPDVLFFVAKIQSEARRAVEKAKDDCKHSIADAEHRTSEKIAQFLEQHRCNLHPDNAAAKVRSLEWDL